MGQIYVRLYEELNDFLPVEKRKRVFAHPLSGNATVGKLLRRLAVPEAEVELALVNGISANFSHYLKEDDFVSLYPVFESFDVTTVLRARRKPLRQARFMASAGLRILAVYLRLLGFDTVDCRSWAFEKIIRVAKEERRTLLTRTPSLLDSPELCRVFLVRGAWPGEQLLDVLSRFDLYSSVCFSTWHWSILNRK